MFGKRWLWGLGTLTLPTLRPVRGMDRLLNLHLEHRVEDDSILSLLNDECSPSLSSWTGYGHPQPTHTTAVSDAISGEASHHKTVVNIPVTEKTPASGQSFPPVPPDFSNVNPRLGRDAFFVSEGRQMGAESADPGNLFTQASDPEMGEYPYHLNELALLKEGYHTSPICFPESYPQENFHTSVLGAAIPGDVPHGSVASGTQGSQKQQSDLRGSPGVLSGDSRETHDSVSPSTRCGDKKRKRKSLNALQTAAVEMKGSVEDGVSDTAQENNDWKGKVFDFIFCKDADPNRLPDKLPSYSQYSVFIICQWLKLYVEDHVSKLKIFLAFSKNLRPEAFFREFTQVKLTMSNGALRSFWKNSKYPFLQECVMQIAMQHFDSVPKTVRELLEQVHSPKRPVRLGGNTKSLSVGKTWQQLYRRRVATISVITLVIWKILGERAPGPFQLYEAGNQEAKGDLFQFLKTFWAGFGAMIDQDARTHGKVLAVAHRDESIVYRLIMQSYQEKNSLSQYFKCGYALLAHFILTINAGGVPSSMRAALLEITNRKSTIAKFCESAIFLQSQGLGNSKAWSLESMYMPPRVMTGSESPDLEQDIKFLLFKEINQPSHSTIRTSSIQTWKGMKYFLTQRLSRFHNYKNHLKRGSDLQPVKFFSNYARARVSSNKLWTTQKFRVVMSCVQYISNTQHSNTHEKVNSMAKRLFPIVQDPQNMGSETEFLTEDFQKKVQSLSISFMVICKVFLQYSHKALKIRGLETDENLLAFLIKFWTGWGSYLNEDKESGREGSRMLPLNNLVTQTIPSDKILRHELHVPLEELLRRKPQRNVNYHDLYGCVWIIWREWLLNLNIDWKTSVLNRNTFIAREYAVDAILFYAHSLNIFLDTKIPLP